MPECFSPILIKLDKPVERTGELLEWVNVPCGKCANCIKRRRMEWCFRMEEELKVSKTAYFVTLTYDPKFVPYDKYGNMILIPNSEGNKRRFNYGDDDRDFGVTNYFKRLRQMHKRNKRITFEMWYNGLTSEDKIKYYVCGEYGDAVNYTGRPHYHAIIFNGTIDFIRECWKWGDVHVVKATKETIAYCTKYMDKWRDKKQDWKRPIEFNNVSEGLGSSFITKMKTFYKSNLDINFVVNDEGVRIPMPRYFRLKMLNEDELSYQVGYIHDKVKALREEKELLLGVEEFNRRMKTRQKAINVNFDKRNKKRDI